MNTVALSRGLGYNGRMDPDHFVKIGKKGGSVKSEAKAKAADLLRPWEFYDEESFFAPVPISDGPITNLPE